MDMGRLDERLLQPPFPVVAFLTHLVGLSKPQIGVAWIPSDMVDILFLKKVSNGKEVPGTLLVLAMGALSARVRSQPAP